MISFPLLIEHTGSRFSPFIQLLFDSNWLLAAQVLQAAVETQPKEAHYLAHLGRLESHAGSHDAALEHLRTAAKMRTPPDSSIWTMLGNAVHSILKALLCGGAPGRNGHSVPDLIVEGLKAFEIGRDSVGPGTGPNTYAYSGEIKLRCLLQSHPEFCEPHNFAHALRLFDQLSGFNLLHSSSKTDLGSLWESLVRCGSATLSRLVANQKLGPIAEGDNDTLQSLAVLGVVGSLNLHEFHYQTWPFRLFYDRLVDRIQGNAEQPFSSDYRALLSITRFLFGHSASELAKCREWASAWATRCPLPESAATLLLLETLLTLNGTGSTSPVPPRYFLFPVGCSPVLVAMADSTVPLDLTALLTSPSPGTKDSCLETVTPTHTCRYYHSLISGWQN